ncbi:MAG: DUF1570 domain-containing protein [Isosphaeraceae bacterium]
MRMIAELEQDQLFTSPVPPMTDRRSLRMPADFPALVGPISRRLWLLGTLLGGACACGPAWGSSGKQGALSQDDKDEIAKVEDLAKKAGIGPFAHSQTEHLIGLGDAPPAFRQSALEIAESLAKVFLGYFKSRGFKAELPARRMTLIILKGVESYRALPGEKPGISVGGHYDLDTNRLVIFDFRPQQAGLEADAKKINAFTLIHETVHLLCFNTGILSREADVPACISEGLATFFELWRPRTRTAFGGNNGDRLKVLLAARNNGEPWIPLVDMVKDDDRIDDPKTEQLAYAESWLLVHFLLKKEAWLPRFRAYLEGQAGPPPNPAPARVEYAESKLGPLAALDRELRKHAREVLARF